MTTESRDLELWEGSSVFVEQGRHWSSAFIWLTAFLFFGSIIWLFTAKVDQTVSARGQLIPSGSVRDIESPSAGVVLDVFIAEGDTVEIGQSLLSFESQGLTASLTAIEQNLQLLKLESDSLSTIIEADGDPSLFGPLPELISTENLAFRAKMQAARNKTKQIRSQLRQLAIRLESKKKSLHLQDQITADLKPLYESGALARNGYFQQLNSLQELRAEVSTLIDEKVRLVALTVGQLNTLHRQEISLRSQLSSIQESISYKTIKAPISGKIFDLGASSYSVVTNSESLLKIVPANPLVANVEISNSDIGFVRIGLPVSVAIDSFPSGEFGYITGFVDSIGSDVLPPDRDSPAKYFPVSVILNQQSVLSGSQQLNLQSGMGLTANIKLRSRPAFSLLTDIFTKQLDGIKRFK